MPIQGPNWTRDELILPLNLSVWLLKYECSVGKVVVSQAVMKEGYIREGK